MGAREQLKAAVRKALERYRQADKEHHAAEQALRRFDAHVLIEKHDLCKSMVVHTKSAGGWIGTLDKWIEWLAANRPDAKWFEWNGSVYESGRSWTRDYVESNPLRYDDLPE